MGRLVRLYLVDSRSIDIDAAISRDACFCAPYDGADAAGRNGKSNGTSHLRDYSWRRLCHFEAGDPWADTTCVEPSLARYGEERQSFIQDRTFRFGAGEEDGKKLIIGRREMLQNRTLGVRSKFDRNTDFFRQ